MSSYAPTRIAFDTFEPETGTPDSTTPIIFIHGVFACKESWLDIPQVIANETRKKVYSLDIRNHGDSGWSEDFDTDILTKDVLHFMDIINCSKAIFIGHSLGGRLVMRVALENGEKIEKIIVEEMFRRKLSYEIYESLISFAAKAPGALRKIPKGTEEAEALKIALNHIYGHEFQEKVEQLDLMKDHCHIIGLKKMETEEYTFKTNLNVLKKSIINDYYNATDLEGLFEKPACFIYGKDSPFKVYKEFDDIRKHFPKAEFVAIDSEMHTVHIEKKKEFLDGVLNFLQN